MNWIGQKISSFRCSLGRKVGHALHTIGSKINHPYVGHLMNNLDNMQREHLMRGGDYEDNEFKGAQLFKNVLRVPATVGSLFQSVGSSMIRYNNQ